MSQVKRLIEKQEAQDDAAISIAVAGGSLKRCEWHPDIVMDAGEWTTRMPTASETRS